MERKTFIRNGIAAIGAGFILPLAVGCKKNQDSTTTDTTSGNGTCTVAPTETEGPFPTKSPASLVITDIKSDRTGVPFTIKIKIGNTNASCAALSGAIVDIWHCDKDGYYSEYGGTGMQQVDLTGVHFLRGRQTTDANGLVTFSSIFPGWYSGRAPHIHVHIYNASGYSLKITQIAFPTDVCDTVYTTATQYYTKGKQDTANTADNIFSDSLSSELAMITGSVANGYTLNHTIYVAA